MSAFRLARPLGARSIRNTRLFSSRIKADELGPSPSDPAIPPAASGPKGMLARMYGSFKRNEEVWTYLLVDKAFPWLAAAGLLYAGWKYSQPSNPDDVDLVFKPRGISDRDLVEACHLKAQAQLRRQLEADAVCIVVEGPPGSGKRETVGHVVENFVATKNRTRRGNEQRYGALYISTCGGTSLSAVVDSVESAIGYCYAEDLAKQILAPRDLSSKEQRLHTALRALERVAQRLDGRLILVVDDLEDLQNGEAAAALLERIVMWGRQRILHPVLISSSADAGNLNFSFGDVEFIQMGEVSITEAQEYLRLRLGSAHGAGMIQEIAHHVQHSVGLRVDHLRVVANQFLHGTKDTQELLRNCCADIERDIVRQFDNAVEKFVMIDDSYQSRVRAIVEALSGTWTGPVSKAGGPGLTSQARKHLKHHQIINAEGKPCNPALGRVVQEWIQNHHAGDE